jgi:hypothetical protein
VRKILVVATVLLVVFVAVFRQRIFLRDPLGKVERNGIAQDGARVYINYSNDALVEDSAKTRFVLVQGWSKVPGIPQHLACVTGLACWTDANEATVFPLGGSSKSASTVMSAKEITFVDESGEKIKVGLR